MFFYVIYKRRFVYYPTVLYGIPEAGWKGGPADVMTLPGEAALLWAVSWWRGVPASPLSDTNWDQMRRMWSTERRQWWYLEWIPACFISLQDKARFCFFFFGGVDACFAQLIGVSTLPWWISKYIFRHFHLVPSLRNSTYLVASHQKWPECLFLCVCHLIWLHNIINPAMLKSTCFLTSPVLSGESFYWSPLVTIPDPQVKAPVLCTVVAVSFLTRNW